MLFDRFPQPFPTDLFAVRSDWPSAFGRYQGPELTYYREWYVDYFGNHRGSGDLGNLHRMFEMYRVGFQYK
jgi:hypothetical protein